LTVRKPAIALFAVALSLVSAGALAAEPASPAPSRPSSWVLNGGTVGAGRNALHVELGWPGLDLTLLHGLSSTFDLGGTFGFHYGFEGIPAATYSVMPGFKLAGVMRLSLAQQPKFNVGLRFSPGLFVYFDNRYPPYWHEEQGFARFGVRLPFEFVAGILVLPQLSVNLGVAVPMALQFPGAGVYSSPRALEGTAFLMPILPGFGAEYRATEQLLVTLDSRYGPSIVIGEEVDATFSFRMLLGAAYRF
jgi:hypothetical protein